MPQDLPGKGFFGWLGRQVGHVKRAVRKDVAKQVIHRQQRIEEADLPDKPNVKLRRTTIDEVIVEKEPKRGKGHAERDQGTA